MEAWFSHNLSSDTLAIIAIPPFVRSTRPRRKWDAREPCAAWARCHLSIPLKQNDDGDQDGNDTDNETKEADKDLLGVRPAALLHAEKIRG